MVLGPLLAATQTGLLAVCDHAAHLGIFKFHTGHIQHTQSTHRRISTGQVVIGAGRNGLKVHKAEQGDHKQRGDKVEIVAVIQHKIAESAHIRKVSNQADHCDNKGDDRADNGTAHKNSHQGQLALGIVQMTPFIGCVNMAADYNAALNLTGGLAGGAKVVALYLLIKRIHKPLVKQELHYGDKQPHKSHTANNTLGDPPRQHTGKHQRGTHHHSQDDGYTDDFCKVQKGLRRHFVAFKVGLVTEGVHLFFDVLLGSQAVAVAGLPGTVLLNDVGDLLDCVIHIFVDHLLGKLAKFHTYFSPFALRSSLSFNS